VTEAIHQMGLWSIRLIFIALAVTPLRRIWQWNRLAVWRRNVGVAAFSYAAVHFTLYVLDQKFDLEKVASEIVLRIYLTIGFVALLGLIALAATSTDSMTRRLGGRRWRRLHQTVYVIALLAVIHFFMQSKLDVWEPLIMAGLYLWLMGWRVLAWRGREPRKPLAGLSLAIGAGVLTALVEAAYFGLSSNVPVGQVIEANWMPDFGVRPAWVVLAITLGIAACAAVRGLLKRAPQQAAARAR
jgi:sulfoxide reductase heme-binding subunit YedZ